MKFSPDTFTFEDFEKISEDTVNKFSFIEEFGCDVEDSVPWLNITGRKTIKAKDALLILNELQANIIDQVLFNSLNGKELRIVVNGKFHFTKEDIAMDFDEEYVQDFGITIEEFKEEYGL